MRPADVKSEGVGSTSPWSKEQSSCAPISATSTRLAGSAIIGKDEFREGADAILTGSIARTTESEALPDDGILHSFELISETCCGLLALGWFAYLNLCKMSEWSAKLRAAPCTGSHGNISSDSWDREWNTELPFFFFSHKQNSRRYSRDITSSKLSTDLVAAFFSVL